jgi:hypothetical protein
MAIINDVTEVLHRIRAKLYPNYLPGVPGKYVARTDDEASLSIEEVCASMKNRGGSTARYEDLVEHVKGYFDEAAYQLADGFSVRNDYFSIHPKIGGTFEGPDEKIDPAKHRIDFSFRVRSRLRELAGKITIVIEGVADGSGFIDHVLDVHSDTVDNALSPGYSIVITGSKIKVDGDKPDTGLYFVNRADGERTKATEHFAENGASKVIATIPASLAAGTYHVEIVTQFTNGSVFLKEPRTIEFARDLQVT